MPRGVTSGSQKRKRATTSEDDTVCRPENVYSDSDTTDDIDSTTLINTSSSAAAGPSTNGPGLDWDWVKKLGEDPTEKNYFPDKYDHFWDHVTQTKGESPPKPRLIDSASVKEYSAWALAIIKKTRASNIVASMVDSPDIEIKWALPLRKFYKQKEYVYREVHLGTAPISNHEATYAVMAGIVIPRQYACEYCKAGNGIFTHCIVLPGFLNGACANCHYNSGGSKCTHRVDATKRRKINGVSITTPIPTPRLSKTKKGKKPQSTSTDDVQFVKSEPVPVGPIAPILKKLQEIQSQSKDLIDQVKDHADQVKDLADQINILSQSVTFEQRPTIWRATYS